MRTISFETACRMLEDCSAVIWDDTYLSYPCVIEDDESVDDEKDALFLRLECEDTKREFIIGDNRTVQVEGKSLWLKDKYGEEIQISPLFVKDLCEYI